MKKLISVLFAIAILFSIAACGSDSTDTSANTSTSNESETTSIESMVVATQSGKEEFNGYSDSTVSELTVGDISLKVPDYYVYSDKSTDTTKIYGIGEDNAVVGLFAISKGSEELESGIVEALNNASNNDLESLASDIFDSPTLVETKEISVPEFNTIAIEVDTTTDGKAATGYVVFLVENSSNSAYSAYLLQYKDTKYSYYNDFAKVLQSIAVAESSTEETDTASESTATASIGINPEFKAAMDEYEKFFDQYVEFMNSYLANPTDMNLLLQYTSFLTQYQQTMEAFENYDTSNLNNEELAYYVEVTARIEQKLLTVIG